MGRIKQHDHCHHHGTKETYSSFFLWNPIERLLGFIMIYKVTRQTDLHWQSDRSTTPIQLSSTWYNHHFSLPLLPLLPVFLSPPAPPLPPPSPPVPPSLTHFFIALPLILYLSPPFVSPSSPPTSLLSITPPQQREIPWLPSSFPHVLPSPPAFKSWLKNGPGSIEAGWQHAYSIPSLSTQHAFKRGKRDR